MENQVKERPVYPGYRPPWYHAKMSTYWWLERWPFLRFILRELSSIFVAYFVVLLLLQLRALSNGPQAYAEFQQSLEHPLWLTLNLVSLLFVLFHSITWFNLAPKAVAIRLKGKRVPDWMISAPNYAVWAVVSVVVAWLLLKG